MNSTLNTSENQLQTSISDEQIAEQVAAQIERFKTIPSDEKPKLTIFEILNALSRNERGDAELFVKLYGHKYVFDSSEGKSGEFYFWDETCWRLDRDRQRYRDMELVARWYAWAAGERGKDQEVDTDEIKALNARAFALRSARRCKSVFEFVAVEIPFHGEWDNNPGLLPCENGIIDLKTGALLEHSPQRHVRTICPTKFNPQAKNELFNKFLDDITLDREEIKTFLKVAFGAALLGDAKEERIFILYGKDGRNGKGTLLQTLEKVLGGFARTFPCEMLLMQRNPPSSSNATPELANLQGVRLAIFSEVNKGRKIDSSKVKNLSGRDTISTRRLYSNVDMQLRPTHTLFLQTNFKPEAPADDNALWTRNVLISFEAHFCETPSAQHERKVDPGLKERLLNEREGILLWLVQSCLEYQRSGLKLPESVIAATQAYRDEFDGISTFLKERCTIDPIMCTMGAKMRDAIKEFCHQNGFHTPNEREIHDALSRQFERKKTNRGFEWRGVSIQPEGEST